jgi:hypothetical protein
MKDEDRSMKIETKVLGISSFIDILGFLVFLARFPASRDSRTAGDLNAYAKAKALSYNQIQIRTRRRDGAKEDAKK